MHAKSQKHVLDTDSSVGLEYSHPVNGRQNRRRWRECIWEKRAELMNNAHLGGDEDGETLAPLSLHRVPQAFCSGGCDTSFYSCFIKLIFIFIELIQTHCLQIKSF